MKLIPKTPTIGAENSERKVFQLLQGLTGWDDWVGLHSVRLDWHLNQVEGEIDFLLIGPGGIFAIEVKGGRIEFDGNVWSSTDKDGVIHRLRKSPMRQASDAMWSLKSVLCGPRFSKSRKIAKSSRWGCLVIFTDTETHVSSVEWHSDKTIVSSALTSFETFSAALKSAIQYHISQDSQRPKLEIEDIELLTQSCRPIFDTVPSLKEELLHHDQIAMALTNEQYKVLDWAIENPRITCAGGAGTGKTLVALEVARRRRDSGHTVIFTCGNRPLLALLARQPLTSGINFVEWSELGNSPTVDFLVVDEAQDFLGPDFEKVLSKVLKFGLTKGEWFVSLDPNMQSGLEKPFDREYLEILNSYATRMKLSKNVRNTRTIIEQTQWATKADLGVEGTGTGPPVIWKLSSDHRTEGDLVVKEIRRLIDEESTHPSEIAVLYLNSNTRPEFSEEARGDLGIPLLDLSGPNHVCGITFTSIASFKGLERQAVLIVGARNLDEVMNPLNHLYTGMSRARGFLWIATSDELGDLINSTVR